jgi:hypothetical protein
MKFFSSVNFTEIYTKKKFGKHFPKFIVMYRVFAPSHISNQAQTTLYIDHKPKKFHA